MSLLFWVNLTILTLVLYLFTCEAESEEDQQFEGNYTRSGRYTRSLSGLYTALGILDLVGGGLRLGAEIANLVAAIGSILQLFSPQQQLATNMDAQLQQQQMQEMQEMQSQNMQNLQNTQYPQEMQSQACAATFSYYASNGYPVYECNCPSGISYQYLRCVNPDASVTSDVQNSPDMQMENVQEVQEQPCTATFSYYASDSRPVYQCDCPGYGLSYQYSRCISPKYARD